MIRRSILLEKLTESTRGLVDFVLPVQCCCCRNYLVVDRGGGEVPFCWECQERLLDGRARCRRCGKVQPESASDCAACRHKPWALDRVFVLGDYRDELRRLVIRGKQERERPTAAALGQLLGQQIQQVSDWELASSHFVVPVPVHWRRFLLRGSHAAGAMAIALANTLAVTLNMKSLRCRRFTRKQGTLSTRNRKANVRGGYSCQKLLPNSTFLLVDDVMTTGATLNEAARTLKKAGAARVWGCVAARGGK